MKITNCLFGKGGEEIIASPRDRTYRTLAGERGGGENVDEKFACRTLVYRAGRGCSYLRNRLYITSLRDHQVPSSPGQCLSTVALRYRDAKISLYLWKIAVFTAYLLPGLMYAVFKDI